MRLETESGLPLAVMGSVILHKSLTDGELHSPINGG